MARPRNYAADLARHLAGRRVGDRPLSQDGRYKYLKRMAVGQSRAQAAGLPFVPQKARGHRPQEHLTERRAAGRRQYAAERREGRQLGQSRAEFRAKWFEERAYKLSGPTMIAQAERWDSMSNEQKDNIIRARNYAKAHRGEHNWQWYIEKFDLDDDDIALFGYSED